MRAVRSLVAAVTLAAWAWAQVPPDLFFNQGTLVYVQSNALVYVQGGYVNNDQGANQGITENYGEIRLVNAAGGWRGSLTNGTGAEFNTHPNSWVYVQGDFTNDGAYRAGTGNYGGTIEFNGTDIQTYQNTTNATDWALHDVRINNTGAINQRHVQIAPATSRDMVIRNSLAFISGRIHTGAHEVRVQNTQPNAVSRTLGDPATSAAFGDLVSPQNVDQYIYGALRWNVAAGQTYQFIVGGDPGVDLNVPDRGIQRIDVSIEDPGGGHYVRVRFVPNQLNPITRSPYCRTPDNQNRVYTPLNNGHWQIDPFDTRDGNAYTGPADLAGVTMHNRVVNNATASGSCTPFPNDDPFFSNHPSDKCFVGVNYDNLTPPNNCEGSNTGFTVTRTGFEGYSVNGSNQYVTVWAESWPLPSGELRLSAAPAGQSIRLTWNLSIPEAEYVLGYELYRKTADGEFSRIAQIDRQGRLQYTHLDPYVVPNTRYYYQVGQHDIFGNVRYSNIVEAIVPEKGDGFQVHLQPNPVVSEGSLLVSLPAEGPLGFTLYDAAGKLVAQNTWTLSAGTHQLDLTPILAQVAAGNYNAHVSFGGDVKTLRLIKADLSR